MPKYLVPVEATIRYKYLVEADDKKAAASMIDKYIGWGGFDEADKDVEDVEIHHGCDDIDFNEEDIYDNNEEYHPDDLKQVDEGIWLASYL